jgi:hypothetical protein
MIVTVTANPSVDRTIEVDHLTAGQVLRAVASRVDAGGKGVNVARALGANGHKAIAIVVAGGPEGSHLLALLDGGIPLPELQIRPVQIAGALLSNITVVEADGTTTKLNEAGPTLSAAELEHADFVSLGTNDLSQYTFAADRQVGDLAELLDPWQPGLLQLVAATATAGATAGKPVSVCGEAASDPLLAVVLTGMGVTSLSMAAGAIADVRTALAEVTLDQCRAAAAAALAAADRHAARQAAASVAA